MIELIVEQNTAILSVKTILVSQPKPDNDKNPYQALAEKHNLKIDFRPFIHVEGVDKSEFRTQRVDLAQHTAVIMTSKTAVDHYFRISEECRFEVPTTMKFFCISEAVAYYLQKYVAYRKRKIFHGKQTIQDLMEAMKKHKKEKYLLPCSDILRDIIPETLDKFGIDYEYYDRSIRKFYLECIEGQSSMYVIPNIFFNVEYIGDYTSLLNYLKEKRYDCRYC